jgi:hypothetical protein
MTLSLMSPLRKPARTTNIATVSGAMTWAHSIHPNWSHTLYYECAEGKYYWVNGACTALPDARSINGWGRTCAECVKETSGLLRSRHECYAHMRPLTMLLEIVAMKMKTFNALLHSL